MGAPVVPDGSDERALSDLVLDYWVSFAATGVPASVSGPDWPAFSHGEAYMHFSGAARAALDPAAGMFEMHSEFIRRRREAGEPWFLNVGVNARHDCEH